MDERKRGLLLWWCVMQLLARGIHEWQCPGCGATTRARMADRPR